MAPDRVPTTELGQVLDQNAGLPDVFGKGSSSTSTISPTDDSEHVAAWLWPNSIYTAERMRTDPQVDALMEGWLTPLEQWRWGLKPNGASETTTLRMAEDLGLPMVGEEEGSDTIVETNGRFDWPEFLRHGLLAPLYGHYFFEIKGEYRDGAARLVKLAPRPPRTIAQTSVDDDGGLEWVQQHGYDPPRIPIERLVVFVWKKEAANWFGRSALRSCYSPWLAKDRLIRDDLTKHRRNATGMPILHMDKDPTRAQIEAGEKLVENFRSADKGGGLVPFGWQLSVEGVSGGTSDPIESAKYHDTQMARRFQQMLMELGSTASGNRALGETFQELQEQAQKAVATWFARIVQEHVIEDFVRWNEGPGAAAPKLVWDACPEPDVDEIEAAAKSGIITMDDRTENLIRAKLRLPPLDPATIRQPAQVSQAVIDPATGLPAAPFPARSSSRTPSR